MLYWPQQWPQRVLPLVLLEPAQVVEQPQQPQPRHHRSLLWRTRLLQLLREFLLICRIRTGEWILISRNFSKLYHFHDFFFCRAKSTVAYPPHGPKDRFKVVKIVTSMPLRRGRWSIVDYPDKDKDKSISKDLGQPPQQQQQQQQQLSSASVPASIVPQQPPPGKYFTPTYL